MKWVVSGRRGLHDDRAMTHVRTAERTLRGSVPSSGGARPDVRRQLERLARRNAEPTATGGPLTSKP